MEIIFIFSVPGNFDAVKKLIKNGANINAVDANNSTPLILAVEYRK